MTDETTLRTSADTIRRDTKQRKLDRARDAQPDLSASSLSLSLLVTQFNRALVAPRSTFPHVFETPIATTLLVVPVCFREKSGVRVSVLRGASQREDPGPACRVLLLSCAVSVELIGEGSRKLCEHVHAVLALPGRSQPPVQPRGGTLGPAGLSPHCAPADSAQQQQVVSLSRCDSSSVERRRVCCAGSATAATHPSACPPTRLRSPTPGPHCCATHRPALWLRVRCAANRNHSPRSPACPTNRPSNRTHLLRDCDRVCGCAPSSCRIATWSRLTAAAAVAAPWTQPQRRSICPRCRRGYRDDRDRW